tara:strand:- start:811 stop:3834 length:3024 start_codon:yes stop_codon:yes gene_type:complete
MPQRQQTQGDFGLRPTKVTQGITDVYHAPSIPKPDNSGLEAIANLSKTAMGLIVEQDKLEKKNAAIAEQTAYRQGVSDRATAAENRRLTKEQTAAGLAFGEDHPFTEVAAESSESYMIGHSEGRGNALRRMFRRDEQAQWDVASQADTGLLRDFTARTQHHDEALVAFLEEQDIDGIARETFLRGAEEHSFELTGKHRVVAMGANKDDFLATGRDMVLNAISSLEGISSEVENLDDTAVLEELNPEGKAPPANAQGYLNMEEHRAELMQNRAAPLTAELQQHLQTAYAMGDSVLKEAVASMSEDLIEEMTNGTNPLLAEAIYRSLKTGTGDFAARPEVVSAYRANQESIHANIKARAYDVEAQVEWREWLDVVSPNATYKDMRAMQDAAMNHPFTSDEQKVKDATAIRVNWEEAQELKKKNAQSAQALTAYGTSPQGGRNVRFEDALKASGLNRRDFVRQIESGLRSGVTADGETVERPIADFVNLLADYTDMPLENSDTSVTIKQAHSLLSSNSVASDPENVEKGLELFRNARKHGIVDRLGLSDKAITYLTHANTALASGDIANIRDLPNGIPINMAGGFNVDASNIPSYNEVQDYLVGDNSGGVGNPIIWLLEKASGGDSEIESVTPLAVSMIQNRLLYNAQRPENSELDKEGLLDLTLEQVKAMGVEERNGTLFRMPRDYKGEDIDTIEQYAKEEAWRLLESDRVEIEEIRAGLDPDALTSEAIEGMSPERAQALANLPLAADALLVDATSMEMRAYAEFVNRHDREPYSYQPEYVDIRNAEDMPIILSSTFDLNTTASYYFTTPSGDRLIFEGESLLNKGLSLRGIEAVITPLKNKALTDAGNARAEAELQKLKEREDAINAKADKELNLRLDKLQTDADALEAKVDAAVEAEDKQLIRDAIAQADLNAEEEVRGEYVREVTLKDRAHWGLPVEAVEIIMPVENTEGSKEMLRIERSRGRNLVQLGDKIWSVPKEYTHAPSKPFSVFHVMKNRNPATEKRNK